MAATDLHHFDLDWASLGAACTQAKIEKAGLIWFHHPPRSFLWLPRVAFYKPKVSIKWPVCLFCLCNNLPTGLAGPQLLKASLPLRTFASSFEEAAAMSILEWWTLLHKLFDCTEWDVNPSGIHSIKWLGHIPIAPANMTEIMVSPKTLDIQR